MSLIERIVAFEVPDAWLSFRDNAALGEHLATLGCPFEAIGQSRNGQDLFGVTCGTGPHHVSVIAGSHADEPAGPMTAQILPLALERLAPELLERCTFRIVPQMNPDGADRNRAWFADPPAFATYIEHAVREQPGDDIEFGFALDEGARPECRAVLQWLAQEAPYAAHSSLHGMGYAEGAWFLLCREWAERSGELMNQLAEICERLRFPLHEIDRQGDKGFTRLRKGFSTTPTATAMQDFFHAQNDPAMAAKFRPSSMEAIAALGGNPLCMVSEMSLFRITHGTSSLEDPIYWRFRDALAEARASHALDALQAEYGIEPVPFATQMRVQLAIVILAVKQAISSL
ncbi:MAG: peptidase M14 [Candidatus Hydrogenedens sp.]|nr:peptidase M14 [Candidatus Hydrogenedens sp.]